MEVENALESIETYKKQLSDVETALLESKDEANRADLETLRDNLKQLIELTQSTEYTNGDKDPLGDEFALFMAEMEKEGAVDKKESQSEQSNIQKELDSLEGTKCRAPHEHQWGDVMYHNAIVCSVVSPNKQQSFDEIEVKVMFINPTHQEMLPCPYLMESSCKFEDDKCKYSHGEIVLFSRLQEYTEPNFELILIGSKVLAKQANKLWSRATVKNVFGQKCLVKFDSNQKDLELELHELLPLDESGENDEEELSDDNSERDDIINMSLMNTPSSQAFGDWEKYTKGFGSKMMQKMGYVVGTGLGRRADGRTEPVTAVILPPGKSLDHCMTLRENSGGDKDFFSVEKKLKRLQKKQEQQNIRAYEREKKKVNVFNFLNQTLSKQTDSQACSLSKSRHRQEIKKESSRNLNVASLQIDEDIKRIERDVFKIKESLSRHLDRNSQMHKKLREKLSNKQAELETLKSKASNISHEQNIRNNRKN